MIIRWRMGQPNPKNVRSQLTGNNIIYWSWYPQSTVAPPSSTVVIRKTLAITGTKVGSRQVWMS